MDNMKQIIPFKKELLFKTKISEITSISLEHTLSLKNEDTVSGEFLITGDYKMTEGSINREKFDFTIPCEITLDDTYKKDSLIVDIDNFNYEVINNESLQVNIDVYIEGEKEEIKEKETIPQEIIEEEKNKSEEREEKAPITKEVSPPEVMIEDEKIDESIKYQKNDKYYLEEENNSSSFNIFENIDNSDTYVTYHVYIVKENDTIDKIMEKFNVTKESIALYNSLDDIKEGTKLIIPNSNE